MIMHAAWLGFPCFDNVVCAACFGIGDFGLTHCLKMLEVSFQQKSGFFTTLRKKCFLRDVRFGCMYILVLGSVSSWNACMPHVKLQTIRLAHFIWITMSVNLNKSILVIQISHFIILLCNCFYLGL